MSKHAMQRIGTNRTGNIIRYGYYKAIKAAVFPLVKKDGMPEVAKEIYRTIKPYFNVVYDGKGAVGRRYRRQDETGTPFCITVDGQTLADRTVTIRDRDALQQWRARVDDCMEELRRRLM
jgi:glycyl-tRNA synthetase